MAIACAISYWAITHALQPLTDRDSDLLGGMWAVAATVFVFRETRRDSVSAGQARLIATCVSFALCLIYLWFFPFTPLGMAALLGIGTLGMMLLDRRGDIVTTGITTAVVMVVAGMSPVNPWHQPLLRLIDTAVGIAVGVACKWIASHVFFRITGKPVR
jgi:uncharacterized membrane protein YccC